MFIVSMKMNRKNRIAFASIAVLALVGALFLGFGRMGGTEQVNANKPKSKIAHSITNSADVATFLKEFGWEVDAQVVEIQQIAIPTEFNEVYQEYNAIQRQQGYDLDPYRGVAIQRYTLQVKNYPDQPEHVVANVLIEGKRVIGGDISCLEQNGFVHGFQAPAP